MRLVQPVPDFRRHRDIQARQHHGAVRQTGDNPQQPGHHRNTAGSAGRQHAERRRFRLPCLGLRIQERDLARSRVHQPFRRQPVRPGARHDLQEAQRRVPVLGELRVRRVGQPLGEVDLRPLGFVHQPGQFHRQLPRGIRAGGRAVGTPDRQDQPRKLGGATGGIDRRRQIERAGQGQRRLVQRPQRDNSRQQQRLSPRHAQKRLRQRPCRAPGRQQDQSAGDAVLGQAKRRLWTGIQPFRGDRVQKRYMRGNREKVHRAGPAISGHPRLSQVTIGRRVQHLFGVAQILGRGQVEP